MRYGTATLYSVRYRWLEQQSEAQSIVWVTILDLTSASAANQRDWVSASVRVLNRQKSALQFVGFPQLIFHQRIRATAAAALHTNRSVYWFWLYVLHVTWRCSRRWNNVDHMVCFEMTLIWQRHLTSVSNPYDNASLYCHRRLTSIY